MMESKNILLLPVSHVFKAMGIGNQIFRCYYTDFLRFRNELKKLLLEVEGHVSQRRIAGDANGNETYVLQLSK